MAARPLCLGLVGCGRIAERGWLPALALCPGVRLVAVADAVPARCAAVAPAVPAFDSAEALVAGGPLDAVLVATPPAHHLPAARAAAEAGIACLVEKPPALDAEGARALAALDPPPWIGLNRRFVPELARLRSVAAGEGSPRLALRFDYRRESWGAAESGDALLDVGVHLVDLARWLTGSDVVDVRAARVEERGAELELELARGVARVSCALDRRYRELVEVRSANGRPLARYDTDRRLARLAARLRRSAGPLVSSLALELGQFAAAVRGEPAPSLATALDGLGAMEAVDAARRVARSMTGIRPDRAEPGPGVSAPLP